MKNLEQWPRVKEIVGAALECSPGEVNAYLDHACSGNEELRTEVDSLLAASQQTNNFSLAAWDTTLGVGMETPQSIGPYRLIRELGVGGMGQVWLAEQSEPVRRQVALKLIRSGFFSPEITERFLVERQSLALMNHPSIAKVFDGGTTPAGQPYLVMEYVEGCPITEYCDRVRLPIRERLRLFQQVCDGVQHAHQKAIIHRDLKPSNILVTEVDGKPVPRIIDFGVAKPVSQGVDGRTQFTQIGSMIGTLGYMSPEQADSGGEDIDTRSDVYSLGVVLYELLVGALPLTVNRLTYSEVLRVLREVDAPRPSTGLRQMGDAAAVAEKRKTDVAALHRQLRGDADAITLKALEKDRNRRYATPAELAADIERFLLNEPVLAHAPSFTYNAGKYLRRHRLGVIMATAAVLLLLGFAIAQTWQLRNVRRERDRADRIAGFMKDMFKVSNPSESRGNTITAREILDKSATQVEKEPGLDASVREQLMQVMAETYQSLGIYSRADDLARRILTSRERSLGAENPTTLQSRKLLGSVLYDEGRDVEAEALLRKTIEQQSRVLGPENLSTLETQEVLASVLHRGAHNLEAERIARTVVAAETRIVGANALQTQRSMNTLAMALQGEGKFAEAENVLRDLIESERRTQGLDHPSVTETMRTLANMLSDQGKYPDAEALYRQTLAIQRRVLGPEHPETGSTMISLANTVRQEPGRKPEAEALYRDALVLEMRVAGPDHAYTTRAKEGLANVLQAQERYAEAEPLLAEVLATRQRVLGPDHTDTLLTQYNLACVMIKQRRLAEAEKLMRKTLEQQKRALDPNNADTLATEDLLAEILNKEGRPAEAQTLAQKAFDAQLRLLGPEHPDTEDSLGALTDSLVKQGEYGKARELRLALIAKIVALPKGDPSSEWYDFADMSASAGHAEDAFDDLDHAIATGYTDIDYMKTDKRLDSLRKDPRFAKDMVAVQKQADAHSQTHP